MNKSSLIHRRATAKWSKPHCSYAQSVTVPLLTLESQIKRGLRKHLQSLGFRKDPDGFLVAPISTKDAIRHLHGMQRQDLLAKNARFIEQRWPDLKKHFASGCDLRPTAIMPRLESVEAESWQSDLFRLASLAWSVPVSQGYGRRMRFLVWDDFNGKLIGLLALGDPVFNLRVRDQWIGWSVEDRRARLVHLMDAFVLGAVPPYNALLCGKLVACLLRTQEIKDAFAAKYGMARGIISEEFKRPKLCLVTTTSALGRSSIYNRLSLGGTRYLHSIGTTSGWGHFHIPDSLFTTMRRYLKQQSDAYSHNHKYGDGPNWRLRAVRKVLTLVGFHPHLLRHGVKREVFVCPIATNATRVLTGQASRPNHRGLLAVAEVASLARERWIVPRAARCPEFKLWSHDEFSRLLSHPPETKSSFAPVIRGGSCGAS